MLVPVEWINDYIDLKDISTDEFCDKMIMSGSNLETCEYFCQEMENVVVGKIEKIEKHPDADKLVVCRINIGDKEAAGIGEDGLLQIVTGAPNVYEGAYVPVALHKSHIPGPLHGQPKQEGGVKITKGKLRGVESFGMLCSAGELGFEDKVVPVAHREGIWILDPAVYDGIEEKLGEDFADALQLKQAVVDFEITPNRPDCLAMIGMAREAAATFGKSFSYPDTEIQAAGDTKSEDYVSVEIKNTDACRRYVARIVTDVKVEQSPWWLQKRLMYAGMRPINNIVDITNFVMLEYGQPLHAFDIKEVHGGKIIVENAQPGEKFTTLDETERILDGDMLMIKDAERSIAVAGVMGGLNSEIEEDTKTIIIESANFNGDSVRTTAKRLGLRTEASARFEKGIDPNLTEAGMPYERHIRDMAREALCGMGLNEIQTYSFVSPSGVDKIRIDEDSWERAFVKIINPLGEENSVMRTVLTPNMLEVLARNYSRNIDKVEAFEIGNTFMDNPIRLDHLPDEDYALCIGMYGKGENFFTLKGVIVELLKVLGIKEPVFVAESEYGVYHPGRCARILVEASPEMKAAGEEFEELGIMGEIHPDVAENYGMDGERIYCCEMMFGAILRKANTEIVYSPLPKFPSTSRDIALLVDENMEVGRIKKVIEEFGKPILESVELFDVYRGKQVEEGKKSVAFNLVYRDMEKTLTDDEVASVHNGVLKALKEKLDAVLREM